MLKPGYILLNADLSQAELRCMALFSDDPWMIGALQEGQGDFFDNHLMPVAYPNEPREFFELDHVDDKGKFVTKWEARSPVEHKEARTKVKAVQYGLAFGRGAAAIGKSLGITTAESQAIINNYFRVAPGFAQWREEVMRAAVNPEYRDILVNPFGRRYQSEIVTQWSYQNVQREALSFLPQSTSSDICLTAAIQINNWLKQHPEYDFKIINIVHDAIMMEGPYEHAQVVGDFVSATLRGTGAAVMGDRVPFLSEWSVGYSWADLS